MTQVNLTPVVIFSRDGGSTEDQALYGKVHTFMRDQAMAEQATGQDSDEVIIARHTRVLQQMAANATEIAQDMGVKVDE